MAGVVEEDEDDEEVVVVEVEEEARWSENNLSKDRTQESNAQTGPTRKRTHLPVRSRTKQRDYYKQQ